MRIFIVFLRGLRRLIRGIMLFVFFIILVPVVVGGILYYSQGWPSSFRTADWSATGIAPNPGEAREAIIQVYAARSGRWKGIFAVHTWIVVKAKGASRFTRYDVVGWGNPVRRNNYPVDGRWYSNVPEVVYELRGEKAELLIPEIEKAVRSYPDQRAGSYRIWPGPNSNTFVAWIGRRVPELGLEMPATAIGKDYLGRGIHFSRTPSGTGWQASWAGIAGIALALVEGLEFHLLGTTIGIDPHDLSIKLPSIGHLGLKKSVGLY